MNKRVLRVVLLAVVFGFIWSGYHVFYDEDGGGDKIGEQTYYDEDVSPKIDKVGGAGDTEVVMVKFKRLGSTWNVDVTLKHLDSGWDHYADMWRIVTEDGVILGERLLVHPHENEQPFTRSLSGVKIPENIDTIIVEARDTVHGWSKDRVVVELKKKEGDRFMVDK